VAISRRFAHDGAPLRQRHFAVHPEHNPLRTPRLHLVRPLTARLASETTGR